MKSQHPTLLAILSALLLSACTGFGSSTLSPDRFSYNQAISQSWKEQLLLNLVRMRYLDTPVFLNVSSVVNQYSYTGALGAGASFNLHSDSDSVSGNAAISYSVRPTITYTPLQGAEFTRRMIAPIPVELLFALGQGGWPMDMLLPICLQRINRVENSSFGPVPSERDRELLRGFHEVVQLFLELQQRSCIDVWRDDAETEGLRYMAFEPHDEEEEALVERLRTLLGLDPALNVFKLTGRVTQLSPDEISLQPRSELSVMFALARGIEVPQAHLSDRRVIPSDPVAPDSTDPLPVVLRAATSTSYPDNPFVAIKYEGHWFYIDHADISSKRAFGLITYLFQLQASGGQGVAPLLTLPAGR